MNFRNLFRWPPPPPPTPTAKVPPTRPLNLTPAPAYQPLPATSTDPLDAALVAAWHAFQHRTRNATWPAFLAELAAANGELDRKIADTRTWLAKHPPNSRLVP